MSKYTQPHLGTVYDTDRHTLAQAKRMPQWQRLITTVHKAQEAAGYEGRQFGQAEMQHFGSTLIGKPVERVARGKVTEFRVYWVERQTNGSSVRYVLKSVGGGDLRNPETIVDRFLEDPSAEDDEATALEFVKTSKGL